MLAINRLVDLGRRHVSPTLLFSDGSSRSTALSISRFACSTPSSSTGWRSPTCVAADANLCGLKRRSLHRDRVPAMTVVLVHGNPETEAVRGPLVDALGREDVVRLSPPGFGAPLPKDFPATYLAYRDWLEDELERFRRAGRSRRARLGRRPCR